MLAIVDQCLDIPQNPEMSVLLHWRMLNFGPEYPVLWKLGLDTCHTEVFSVKLFGLSLGFMAARSKRESPLSSEDSC